MFECPEVGASGIGKNCPSGSYCPERSSAVTVCPSGSFCPSGSPSPILCPGGYTCPADGMDSAGFECDNGTYCPVKDRSLRPTALWVIFAQVDCPSRFSVRMLRIAPTFPVPLRLAALLDTSARTRACPNLELSAGKEPIAPREATTQSTVSLISIALCME